MTSWADRNGISEFRLFRPKLMAMLRLIDDDRNGYIGLDEFKAFAKRCIGKREELQSYGMEDIAEEKAQDDVTDEQAGTESEPPDLELRADAMKIQV